MKKNLLTLGTIISLSVFSMSAHTLSPRDAVSRAEIMAQGIEVNSSAVSLEPVMTLGKKQMPTIYIFNKSEGGFVIVGADDVAAPVLGYSDNGFIDPANLPENLKWWLEELNLQITNAAEAGASQYVKVSRADYTPIAPLVSTRWDQDAPYNNLCPQLNSRTTVTGCVATAFAQILKYHNWPEQLSANSNFSYTWSTGGTTLSWNASNQPLDWANMLDMYIGNNYNSTQAEAVATLMKACGYSVGMNYNVASAGGSGAVTLNVATALVKNFNYDKGVQILQRAYFDTNTWNELIYSNLRDCGPVLLSGRNNEGGHAFVCDGYQSDGYYHINWGWSGMSDGYFLLSALSPENQGIGGSSSGYNIGLTAIAGIKKPDQDVVIPNFYANGTLSATTSALYLSISISNGLYNYTPAKVNGAIKAKIVSSTGDISYANIQTVQNLDFLYGYNIQKKNISIANFPADGTYKVTLVFQPTNSQVDYDVHFTTDQLGYIEVVRDGSTITASVPAAGEFKVTDVSFETPFFANKTTNFMVKGTATWSGQDAVSREISALLLDADGKLIAQGSPVSIDFEADNNPSTIEYVSSWTSTFTAGDYYFAFGYSDGNQVKLISDPAEVTVQASTGTTRITVKSWSVANQTSVDPHNIEVTVKLSCTSGFFCNSLTAAIFEQQLLNYINIGQFSSPYLSINSGETKDFTFTGSMSGLEVGKRYVISLYNGSTQLTNAMYITIGESGIEDITVDDAMAPAEYFNLQGQPVENPVNGIFIRRQGGKTEKVLIK